MTDQERAKDQLKRILKRLRQTRNGETLCLADWEIRILLDYIAQLERK